MANETINTSALTVNFVSGIIGEKPIPANAAVLISERVVLNRQTKERELVRYFLAVEGVKSTKTTDLIIPVLALMLAEARERGGFESRFGTIKVHGEDFKTGLRDSRCRFASFLKGNVLYKSNSDGELNKALVLDDGLTLDKTVLSVKKSQAIYAEERPDVLRTLLFTQAKGVQEQATLMRSVTETARAIFDIAYAEPVAPVESEEKRKKRSKKSTAKAPAQDANKGEEGVAA